MSLQSIIEWKRPAEEMPDAEITVLVAFHDGEVDRGYWDSDCWRSMENLVWHPNDPIVAWAHMPEVPECLLKICENPRNLRKETEGK
jgi:hypothetical protein